jgi:acyl carrier protein
MLDFMVARTQHGGPSVSQGSAAPKTPVQNVRLLIRCLLADRLELKAELLNDEAHFLNDLGVDWLDLIEIVTALEMQFDIEFDDHQIDELHRVGDLIRFVEAHRARS